MKKVSIIYSPGAYKELDKLTRQIALRITTKIEYYTSETSDPLASAKALSGTMTGLYRYRIGDYRVIFEIDQTGTISILLILSIKHRKDIYR